jgi:hypothetical protein
MARLICRLLLPLLLAYAFMHFYLVLPSTRQVFNTTLPYFSPTNARHIDPDSTDFTAVDSDNTSVHLGLRQVPEGVTEAQIHSNPGGVSGSDTRTPDQIYASAVKRGCQLDGLMSVGVAQADALLMKSKGIRSQSEFTGPTADEYKRWGWIEVSSEDKISAQTSTLTKALEDLGVDPDTQATQLLSIHANSFACEKDGKQAECPVRQNVQQLPCGQIP